MKLNQDNLNKEMMTLSKLDDSKQWNLIWEDSFELSEIDSSKWNFVEGGWGFGNEESQYYTARKENARIENGKLVLEARQEAYEKMNYTSAKLTTKGKAAWKYGRFSIRAKMPEGQGIWPAIWMMPEDMERYSGWPACGEIDIMEQIGHQPGTVYGTLHYGLPHTYTGENYTLPGNAKFSDDFHVFTLDWEPGEFRWYVDGVLYARQNEWFTKPDLEGENISGDAPFDREFYLQLNLAVGGKWPGYPDETTTFPQQMIIDYIKVYEKQDE
ncbi:glycoside hydrolase family 16 protein [Bacillus sp. 31A1R]|uniref:Glycoside hydrolase family 16 protein n=1 Tax=Robertmurraya mangrovi TaxID=3098077 RepID=A0ABU5IYQ1_9BACI|nr:glycoside hydrolase family 16 protein [Bacillus sp. 31A1R]MDZ5472293.1 glycoside hydrolase family 16 protein [Bacillus sp. 31A1R]